MNCLAEPPPSESVATFVTAGGAAVVLNMNPPAQLDGPLRLSTVVRPREPLVRLNGPLMDESLARVRVPPLIASAFVQLRLRIDWVVEESVTVSALGWLMTTSSLGPGRFGLLDQL